MQGIPCVFLVLPAGCAVSPWRVTDEEFRPPVGRHDGCADPAGEYLLRGRADEAERERAIYGRLTGQQVARRGPRTESYDGIL